MLRGLLLAMALTLTPAAAGAAGVNLSWDDCGEAGIANKAFACNTNIGTPFVLVGSYVAPAGTVAITGIDVSLDIGSASPTLPDWWKFRNAGACRFAALTYSADFGHGNYFACTDYWAGQAAGGITAYITPFSTLACKARLRLVVAVPAVLAVPLETGLEYYAFRLSIDRTNTLGDGACAGCLTPTAILLNEIKLTQPVGVGDFRLQHPAHRNYVTWQGGDPSVSCLFVTARNSTWGAIKAQYR